MARTEIRRAQPADAAEMARLAEQLGYPMSEAEMSRRLAVLLASDRHHVAVAVCGERLSGWMQAEHRFSLEGGDRAELMGLVVDLAARRSGLGCALLDAAERWALSRGLSSLTVRSNAARLEAHPFYESLGFSRSKTQHVYTRTLTAKSAEERR